MKKLLLILSLLPVMVKGQQFEAGLDYGNATDVTASIRLLNHLKAGLGYEYTQFTESGLFGGHIKTTMNIPYVFVDYYNVRRKHEFYCGMNFGKVQMTEQTAYSEYRSQHGSEFGLHAGYSRKLIAGLYANAQVGITFYQATLTSNFGAFTNTVNEERGFVPVNIGLHYIFGPFRKKAVVPPVKS